MANNQQLPAPRDITRNITSVFRSATPEQFSKGLTWYDVAADAAEDLSLRYGVTVDVAAGIIAALSPNNSWGHNLRLAERFIAEGGLSEGYFGAQLAKARDILAGADIMHTLGASARKTQNFYRSIVTRGREGMTIDRHAYAIATDTRGETPSLGVAKYAALVAGYERAAKAIKRAGLGDFTPAQVQAITWVAWRDRFWAAGAWE